MYIYIYMNSTCTWKGETLQEEEINRLDYFQLFS